MIFQILLSSWCCWSMRIPRSATGTKKTASVTMVQNIEIINGHRTNNDIEDEDERNQLQLLSLLDMITLNVADATDFIGGLETSQLDNTNYCDTMNRLISLIESYPRTFLHFLQHSTERKNNWNAIVYLISQSSPPPSLSPHNGTNETNCSATIADNKSTNRSIVVSRLQHVICSMIFVVKRGWTLLHWLCSTGGAPLEIFETITKRFCQSVVATMIMQQDTYISDTPLHLLCRNACQFSSNKLQLLLQSLSRDNAKNAVLIRNRLGGTILHAAAIGGAVYDAVNLIVSTNPAVVRITSHDGIYPVTALWYSYSDTIPGNMSILGIIEGSNISEGCETELLDFKNVWPNEGFRQFWRKLEYIAVGQYRFSVTCPDHLRYDKSITSEIDDTIANDKSSDLRKYVLHALLQSGSLALVDMMKLCLKINPSCCKAADINGNFPLHILVKHRPYRLNKEYEAIGTCLMVYPQAASIPNKEKQIPLQLCIENKIPVSSGVYELLLKVAPSTIQYRNDESTNGLYLYQLAAIQNNTTIEAINTIYYLLLQQPDLLHN